MAEVASCPNLDDLRRFALGRLPETDAERLQQHLASCANCLDALHNLEAKDTLVEAMRVHGNAAARSEDSLVAGLVAQLDGQQRPAAETTIDAASPTAPKTKPEDCSFLAPPETPEELGRLGGYRVLKILGAGGMGIVLEAEDVRLKRHVALKVMKPALAASAVARRRFLREAQSVAAIEHDHIVAIHKVGEDRGVPYLAMPLLRGETLEERLKRQEAAVMSQGSGVRDQEALAEMLRIGREIAEGLTAAEADQPLLPRWTALTESQNVFSGSILKLHHEGGDSRELLPSLEEWNQFWGQKDTGSLQGQPVYQRDGLRAELRDRRRSIPSPPTLVDFKLAPQSLGTRMTKGGGDLGARVEFIGPGRPYEVFRTNPKYQDWLKRTGQRP